MKKICFAMFAAMAMLSACSDDDNDIPVTPGYDDEVEGLYIINNGNWNAGNASLTFYDPDDRTVKNDVFYAANGYKLGDTAQSATHYDDRLWVVVNGSNVIYAIDDDTYKVCGSIQGLSSPRDIFFVNNRKAYVTQMWTDQIAIVDPLTCTVTGYITVAGATGGVEHMVSYGGYVYANCWNYGTDIVKINPATDTVEATLSVGRQPYSLALDAQSATLWVLCDGYYEDWMKPCDPSLAAVDLTTFTVTRTLELTQGDMVASLCYHDGNIYWLEGGVKIMHVRDNVSQPVTLIPSDSYGLYAMTVNPDNGDIYVADAIDYTQPGVIYRYNKSGLELDRFTAGIIPASFCWEIDD